MVIKQMTPLTQTEKKYIKKIIKFIEDERWVFVIGPNRMGKTTIIENVIKEIKKSHKMQCFLFDLKKAEKGAFAFYQNVIETVSHDELTLRQGTDISNEFITKLDTCIDQETLLVFNNFRAINQDFYDHFSRDCRKIFNQGNDGSSIGLSKIRMIFAGSLVSSISTETSPLWNITETVEILPLGENELKEIISANFGSNVLDDLSITFIDTATYGHRYLAGELTRFFKNRYKPCEKLNYMAILEQFIDFIWETVNRSYKELDDTDEDLKEHFQIIVEYLENSAEVLWVVLEIQDHKIVQGARYPLIDDISITGALAKDEDGCYHFANPIYAYFFEKLLVCHRRGDFCLYYASEKIFWNRAIDIYRELFQNRKQRDVNEPPSPGRKDLKYLIRNILKGLRASKNTSEFITKFTEIICYVFDSPAWGVYVVNRDQKQSELLVEDLFFNVPFPRGRWLSDEELNSLEKFYKRALSERASMFDWTSEWFALPVLIREDFGRIFITRVGVFKKRMKEYITILIREALTFYYYLRTQEKNQKELERLKGRLHQLKSFSSPDYRESMKSLWQNSKQLFMALGIHKFSVYEIIFENRVLCTTQDDDEWIAKDRWSFLDEMPQLKHIVLYTRKNPMIFFRGDSKKLLYFGAKLDSGTLMIFQLPDFVLSQPALKKHVAALFNLMKFTLDKSWNLYGLEILRQVMTGSEDYLYVVDKKRTVLFINSKLEKLLQTENSFDKNTGNPCYQLILKNESACQHCAIDEVFRTGKMIRVFRDTKINGKTLKLNFNYYPIQSEKNSEKPIAVAIFMHDLGDRQRLWEALETMEKTENFAELEDLILHTLRSFGFKRVFRFRPDPMNKGRFISEDYVGEVDNEEKGTQFKKSKKSFTSTDEAFLDWRVCVWHRKNTPHNEFKKFLKNRLENSGFQIKQSQSMIPHDEDHPRVDFWISLPIYGKEGIIKMYILDNWGVEKRDKETISVEKLQILETFGRAAGQRLENARRWEQFQHWLSHGTNEPLHIARFLIDELVERKEIGARRQLGDELEAALDQAQAALGSILARERGPNHLKVVDTDIIALIKDKVRIFQIYATQKAEIQFLLNFNEKTLFYRTDPVVLGHVLNNLLANAVRHLEKVGNIASARKIEITAKRQENRVIIEVADNGEGLPVNIKEYFQKKYKPGMAFPTGGMGLGSSREMAYLLGGKLKLKETTSKMKGTCVRLVLREKK